MFQSLGALLEAFLYGAVVYGLYALIFLLSTHALSLSPFQDRLSGGHGTIFCLSTLLSTPPAILLILFISGGTKESIQTTLGLYAISLKETSFACLLALLLFGIYQSLSVSLCGGSVPDPVIRLFHATKPEALFYGAMLIAAPLFEEVFFRGFLFHFFKRSPVGETGAVISTAIIWSLGHLQYEMWEMGILFFIGIVLALFRVWGKSLYPALLFHLILNMGTSLELSFFY